MLQERTNDAHVRKITFTGYFFFRIRSAMKLQQSMATLQARQATENQRKELNMTIVLVCIVVMFIFCQSIKIIPDIYEAVKCDHSEVRRGK